MILIQVIQIIYTVDFTSLWLKKPEEKKVTIESFKSRLQCMSFFLTSHFYKGAIQCWSVGVYLWQNQQTKLWSHFLLHFRMFMSGFNRQKNA